MTASNTFDKLRVYFSLLFFSIFSLSVFAQTNTEKVYGVINLSVVDVRVQSSFASEMATQSLLGTPVKILQKDKWYKLQTPDGYTGWAERATVQPMTKKEFNEWANAPKIIFTDYFGFSYTTDDANAQTVSDLVYGDILKLIEENDYFYKAAYPDGRIAYVLKNQSVNYQEWLANKTVSGNDVVKNAFSLMGIPYSWGGTSVKAMDCSGFTKTVYYMSGIILMRDAWQQAQNGVKVDISKGYDNLQMGDLLFFGKRAQDGQRERVRHVAIYIGDKKFIQAAGRVKVSSFDPKSDIYDELNTKELLSASRIIGAEGTKGIWKIANHPMYQQQP